MYTVVHLKDIKNSNPKEDKSYKVKYQSDYLDAIVITIGSRAHCNKELKLRTSNKFLQKKDKSTKVIKASTTGKQSSEQNEIDQNGLLLTENSLLKTENVNLKSKICVLENSNEENQITIADLKHQIEIFKQNFSNFLNLSFKIIT